MPGKAVSIENHPAPSASSAAKTNNTGMGLLSGSIADMLGISGRIALSTLQKIYLVCDKEAFVNFIPKPTLVGSAILLGNLRAPVAPATTEKNRTAVFELIDNTEDSTSVSESIQKAIYPLIKSHYATAGTGRFFIGRLDGNDIIMPDLALSKRHAVIDIKHGTYYLSDCGSTNGTMINGNPVGDSPEKLCDGDVVSFARYEFTILSPSSLYDKLRTS